MTAHAAPADPVAASYRALGGSIAAGVIAGVLVVGVAGRIAMRISAVAADSDGALTEGGTRVGDITVGGALALIIVGGLLFGVGGGLLLYAIRPWLPRAVRHRVPVLTVAFPLIAGTTVIAEENTDFFLLDPPELNVAMFFGLFAAFGAVAATAEAAVDRLLPAPGPQGFGGGALAGAGLAVPVALVSLLFLADQATFFVAPFIGLAGAATLVRPGGPLAHAAPSRFEGAIEPMGYAALVGACLAGSAHAVHQVNLIV